MSAYLGKRNHQERTPQSFYDLPTNVSYYVGQGTPASGIRSAARTLLSSIRTGCTIYLVVLLDAKQLLLAASYGVQRFKMPLFVGLNPSPDPSRAPEDNGAKKTLKLDNGASKKLKLAARVKSRAHCGVPTLRLRRFCHLARLHSIQPSSAGKRKLTRSSYKPDEYFCAPSASNAGRGGSQRSRLNLFLVVLS